MESEINLQIDYYEKMVKARNNFKKSPKERITQAYCQARLESLEMLWSDFTKSHKVLVKSYGSKLKEQDYYKKDIYEQTEEFFIEYKTEIKLKLDSLSSNLEQTKKTNKSEMSSTELFKLPKIVIPSFSGKYTEWITFRDLFLSLIHSNSKLDKVQKMHYLKSSLTGEAEQLLRQIPISEANYDRCWGQLKARYDNKRYLSHFILKRLLSQRNLVVESSSNLKELIDTTNDCLSGLQNLGIDISNWDVIIIHIICLKLDQESRKQWEFNITNSTQSEELPTLDQFREFLTNRYRALEFLDTKVVSNKYQPNTNKNFDTVKFKSLHVNKLQCVLCSDNHNLSSCKKFVNQTVDQRRDFVKFKNLCYNCLGIDHGVKNCKSRKCNLCHRSHHTLLHPRVIESGKANVVQVEPEADKVENSAAFVACNFSTRKNKSVLLATALVNAVSKNGQNHVLRVLLDQGSQGNFVTEATVSDLKLKKTPIRGNITGVGGNREIMSKAIVTLNIKSRFDSQSTFTVQAYVLKSITSFLPGRKVDKLEISEFEGIELADPEYYWPKRVDLLLGAELYSQIIQEGIRKDRSGSIVAQSTSLGWILSGALHSSDTYTGVVALHCQLQESDELLKRFWEIENGIGLTKEKSYTEEEKRCENYFVKTTSRDETGRYIVRLPFKTDNPICIKGESRSIAEKRLKGLIKRLEKDKTLQASYKTVMEEYLQMNHMIKIEKTDNKRESSLYLAHHPVIREDKKTTKLRIVFNASQVGMNGVALNDELLVGPSIQPDLRHLVMQWRLSKICLTADIIKMYRQIKVHEEDTDYQRLLWIDPDSQQINDYKLLRVTFGTASAPFLAVRTLHQVAVDEGLKYPLAAEKVRSNFYMDDLMCGCETVSEGIEIYKQMKGLLKEGGFELQKWASNSNELMEIIRKNEKDKEEIGQDTKEERNIKMDEVMKILGLTWEIGTDNFRYKTNLLEQQLPMTKRKMVSDISRLFDPIGWITPCIIVAKIMIQKLWIAGIGWDDEIPKELLQEWCQFRKELHKLQDFRIPRWLGTTSGDVQTELHGFCDASKMAYAAVVYIRRIDCDGNVHMTLVAAKSRVAPIKQISIPRLELCGAVELTRLMIDVAKVMNIDGSKLHAWTDSTIVLAWLNSIPNRWKVFVANRVAEILTSLNPSQWSHVSTENNPADCASRGITPSELVNKTLWLNGPSFLLNKVIKYEKPAGIKTNLEAIKVHCTKEEENEEIWDRFSSLNRMVRVIAYCRRFAQRKNPKIERDRGYLKTEELKNALETCIRQDQIKYFDKEIKKINQGEIIKGNSVLKYLNPMFDEVKILRVGGRLEKSNLEQCTKHPIILAKKSKLSKLIIADAHKQTLHGGPQLTINYLRSKYFIIGVKQLVKAYVRKCVVCVKSSGLTQNQLMGQLPSVRVTPARPFLRSGVDFAGPIQMRTSRGRGFKSHKGYICLFVCMCTKAVHLEAVSDLTTQGFLQAFKRFVARRGRCEDIWSDNGTNFVGASAEIKRLFSREKASILPEIAEILATNNTSWHFIPPRAPHFGGLWEAGIKSAKRHLKSVIGTSTLTYEEMSTVLAQIESCLNSRPLSRLDSDQEMVDILTPGHFLIGEALVNAPDHNYETANISSLRRWQYTQRMSQEFWRKWSKEYLNQYFHRYRWSTEATQIKIGDIVLIKEDGLPPCRWLYGQVVKEHPGMDGISRVVTVRCKNTLLKRPINKLCILPVTE